MELIIVEWQTTHLGFLAYGSEGGPCKGEICLTMAPFSILAFFMCLSCSCLQVLIPGDETILDTLLMSSSFGSQRMVTAGTDLMGSEWNGMFRVFIGEEETTSPASSCRRYTYGNDWGPNDNSIDGVDIVLLRSL